MNKEKIKYFAPWAVLALLYISLILAFDQSAPMGDEIRYLKYAENLTHGFYVDAENPSFRNGPGYPLVLTPFQFFDSATLYPRLMNALFLFLAVVYFRKALKFFTTPRIALFGAFALGLYPPMLRWLPYMYSEALALFLVCGFIYYYLRAFNVAGKQIQSIILSSIFLGFLILTKIIFFHVLVVGILFLIPLFFTSYKESVIRIFKIAIGAFIIILPYVISAYSWSGKLFYLGTGGGEILYHRTTPHEGEWGNWFSREDVLFGDQPYYKNVKTYGDISKLTVNHKDFYLSISNLNYIEQDSAFKSKAIENIKKHPQKYIKNTAAGIGRFVVNYPYSYRNHNMGMFLYMLPNMLLLVLCLIFVLPAIRRRAEMPFELLTLLFFCLVYAAGIIALEGRARNFIVMVPFLIGFLFYGYNSLIQVQFGLSKAISKSK